MFSCTMLVVDKLLLSMALFASEPAVAPQTKDAKVDTPPTALGPAETVQAYLHATGDMRFEGIWPLLPPSHREVINKSVRRIADRVDPILWDKGFDLARKFAGTFKTKREYWLPIFEDMAANNAPATDIDFDVIVGLYDIILESELADINKLKKFDGGQFLEKTAKPLMKLGSPLLKKDDLAFYEQLRAAKVTLVSEKPGIAVVRIEISGESGELTLVQMEGHWIFKGIAGWSDAKAAPVETLKIDEEERKKWLSFMEVIDKRLDKMAAAKSQEEFEDATRSAFMIVMPSVITWISQQARQPKGDEKGQDDGR